MSMQIQNSGQPTINSIEELYTSTLQALNQSLQKIQQEGLPKTGSTSTAAKSDVPELPQPSHHGLSLETLIDALGFEQRRTNCQAGLTSLEAKAAEQKEINEKTSTFRSVCHACHERIRKDVAHRIHRCLRPLAVR